MVKHVNGSIFLLLNLALSFYGVGAIWAHELDIFRSWRLLDPETFHRVQSAHWRKLPYWVLLPVAFTFAGSVALIWYHPAESPVWAIWAGLGCQAGSHILTAVFWGPWQARLSRDALGSESPWLRKILSTHWIRTALISGYGVIILAWAINVPA